MNGKRYYADYPTEPIGRGNPYYRCSCCKISDPEINGRLEGHSEDCEYRIRKEKEIREIELKPAFIHYVDSLIKLAQSSDGNSLGLEQFMTQEEIELGEKYFKKIKEDLA